MAETGTDSVSPATRGRVAPAPPLAGSPIKLYSLIFLRYGSGMTDQPENLVIEILRTIRSDQTEIRAEIQGLRSETNLKIGTLAESMVSMRKDINGLITRMGSLEIAVEGVRTDIRMIALAVDEHSRRLDGVESRLDKIEARLPPLHNV